MLTFIPFMLRPPNMSGNSSPPPPSPPGGSMGIMLVVMIGMTLLILNPNIRTSLGDMADPILAPILPESIRVHASPDSVPKSVGQDAIKEPHGTEETMFQRSKDFSHDHLSTRFIPRLWNAFLTKALLAQGI